MEVGREDHKRIEGHLELLARLQRQDIVTHLHRNDPAVDDFLRRLRLAAEIVDDEDAARRLELQRRLIGAGDRVVLEIEHVERQLAAGHHGRALAQHVAAIDPDVGLAQRARLIGLPDPGMAGIGAHVHRSVLRVTKLLGDRSYDCLDARCSRLSLRTRP